MYSVSLRCSDHKKCSERAPLGPPDNYCVTNDHEKIEDVEGNSNYPECEFADDAITMDKQKDNNFKSCINRLEPQETSNPYITVNGKEELPCIHKYYMKDSLVQKDTTQQPKESVKVSIATRNKIIYNNDKINMNINYNACAVSLKNVYGYCTLPKNKKKRGTTKFLLKTVSPPKRVTPDGTHIYYWCDIKKKDNGGKSEYITDSILGLIGNFDVTKNRQ